jgi:predicted nucleic acid-binding protein
MPVLLDTNILLRSAQTVHPMHEAAVMTLARLSRQDERLVVTGQNIAELWNVATRLVSVMKPNEVTHILTFNASDFTRYPGIEAIHPGELA